MIAVGVTYITDYCPSIKQQPKPHYHICVFFVLPFPFVRWYFRIVIERGMHASIESIRDAYIRMLFIYRAGNKSSAQYRRRYLQNLLLYLCTKSNSFVRKEKEKETDIGGQ